MAGSKNIMEIKYAHTNTTAYQVLSISCFPLSVIIKNKHIINAVTADTQITTLKCRFLEFNIAIHKQILATCMELHWTKIMFTFFVRFLES